MAIDGCQRLLLTIRLTSHGEHVINSPINTPTKLRQAGAKRGSGEKGTRRARLANKFVEFVQK